ncbi:(2Fe-2S)-binding protein [Gymnodinialimonas ceratoperidinii]|uniref:(2Fe-2S)-binding protein n=1 Tax=Gymnodinialimonas ceratoperidinii TaxID=2856823 RepID=A0A8F6TVK2_9RHOB|nr:(2Fe-2S)-binding protein [Gymnodinialimonas ceratoperidinii]QXT39495.1 (2Fe-2S)-binding protein [Gymnodinialimonas ceratoperidinii]
MSIASRFLPPPKADGTVCFTLDGEPVMARDGDTLAVAILAHTGAATRTTASGSPRAPYCMMGVCFECLVEVDGRPNVQACLIPVREGMAVRRQDGLRGLRHDG